MEIWKTIEGFNNLYECSNLGNFRKLNKDKRCNKYRYLKGCINSRGYINIKLPNFSSSLAHRFIAKTFLDNPNNFPCVNHINGIRNDNRVENLEWCTQSHNIKHSYSIGNKIVTEKQYNQSLINLSKGKRFVKK